MGWADVILALLAAGFGKKPAAPPALRYRMRVNSDAEGMEVLQYLESVGTVEQLVSFDGEIVDVVWRGRGPRSGLQLDLVLDDAGVEVLKRGRARKKQG